MTSQPTPKWHPITQLSFIASMIDGMLHEAKKQYKLLGEARLKPWALDDYTMNRVTEVFTEQYDDLWLYREQLRRWRQPSLKSHQYMEIERLSGQLDSLQRVITDILVLADELK